MTKGFGESKFLTWVGVSFTFLSSVGFGDSLYLTISHYQSSSTVCSFLEGCSIVTTSQYATALGLPVSFLGMVFYFAVFSFSFTFLFVRASFLLKPVYYLSILGFLASLWFVYLQIFVIGAICFYCMVSAATSTLLLTLSLFMLFRAE